MPDTFYKIILSTCNTIDLMPNPNAHRAVKLTDGMEEVFVQNYANDHFIFAQYFGSTSGLLRYFPAYYWETNNQVYYTIS